MVHRQVLVIGLFISVASSTASGQIKQSIVWSTEAECQSVTPDRRPGDAIKCDRILLEGRAVRIVENNGVFLAVTFEDDGDYVVADVYVRNGSRTRFDVDPGNWVILHAKSEEHFLRTAEISDPFYPIPAEQIASKVVKRVRWANIFSGGSRTVSVTSESTSRIGDSTGRTGTVATTTNSTVVLPNESARQRNRERLDDARQQAENIVQSSFRANTLFTGQHESGVVYLKRSKKDKYSKVIMKIDQTNYVFNIIWG